MKDYEKKELKLRFSQQKILNFSPEPTKRIYNIIDKKWGTGHLK